MPLQGPYPQYGDLIEFFRPVYTHWGVYVGNGYVVHLSDLDGLSSLSSAFGCVIVKKEPLWHVANGDIYRVNNKDGKNREPYPPKIIVKRALGEVGKTKEYNLTSHNCEHFATKLRYGDGFSDQVRDAAIYTAGATAALLLAGFVAGAIYSNVKDKRQRE